MDVAPLKVRSRPDNTNATFASAPAPVATAGISLGRRIRRPKLVITAFCLVIATTPADVANALPVPTETVRLALDAATRPAPAAQRPATFARFLAALHHLDALPPAEARALLAAFSTPSNDERRPSRIDPRIERRADFELARLDGRPWSAHTPSDATACFIATPDVPTASQTPAQPDERGPTVASGPTATATPSQPDAPASAIAQRPLPPNAASRNVALTADLVDSHLRALTDACQRVPIAPHATNTGALDLAALAPADGVHGTYHLFIPIAPSAPTRLGVGLSGDLVLSHQAAAHTWLGYALGLRGSHPDQIVVDIPAGPATLILTLHTSSADPPLLRLAFFDPVGPPASTPQAPGTPSQAPSPGPPAGSPTAISDAIAPAPLWGAIARRLLGLPDVGRPLEDRLGLSPAVPHERLSDPDLLLALSAISRDEARMTLLELARLDARSAAEITRALAHFALSRGQTRRARDLLDTLQPHSTSDRLLTARVARYEGHPEVGLVLYGLAAADRHTVLPLTAALTTQEQNELAQAALEIGRADLSAAIRVELATAAPGRLDLQSAAIAALVAAGEIEPALALADRIATSSPDRPALALDAAERHLARESAPARERAKTLLDSALARLEAATAPDPDLLVRAGQLLESMNDPTRAIAAFSRAIGRSPGHTTARRHLERLQGRRPVPLTLDAASLVDTPVIDPDATFEVLGEEVFIRAFADGSSTRWVRRVLRAQNVPTSREARTHRIRFDPARESVTVLSADVLRGPGSNGQTTPSTSLPKGLLREPVVERHVHTLGEDWYGLYYDLRQLSIPFDQLERDDLVELTWRVDPVGQLFPGLFDVFEILADRIPKHTLTITVEYPPTLPLRHRLSPLGKSTFTVAESLTASGDKQLILRGKDIAPVPVEPHSPGAAEVSPVWQVTSFSTWRELATWYRRLIQPTRIVTPAMRQLVAMLAKDQTRDELLARLVSWVTREIRYVGLEFGVHGYRPYRTDEVWNRRFGDCKDKATLLTTLLSIAGIESEVVLVRTRKQGRLDDALPSLALFDHAIVWLPQRFQLVDATAIHHGLGELPREDQGAQILVLTAPETPADLAISPTDPASRNGIAGRYSITVDRLGRGGIQAVVSMLGVHAPLYRSMLLEPASRKKRFEEVLNRRYPGLTLIDLTVSNPNDHRAPIELVFTGEIARIASRADTAAAPGLQIPRPAGIDGQSERIAPEPTRSLPLVLGPPTRWDLRFRYVFPEGYRASRLPAGGAETSRFGSYRIAWSEEQNVITVEAELELTVDQVTAADYPDLRRFIRAFDDAVAPALVAAPTKDLAQ